MACDWITVNDDMSLSSQDQVRISLSFDCAPLSSITPADISNFLTQQNAISAVIGVEQGTINSLTSVVTFNCSYVVTVNPANGVTAGDVRNAAYTALNAAAQTHTIVSSNILVGTIQRQSTGVCNILPSAPSGATAFSLWAIALIVLAFVFLTVRYDLLKGV